METISFYSYKGGTGRTLVVANVARYLARFGQNVVALDFDLEAPGLHYKFNIDRPNEPMPIVKGLVDYLYEFVAGPGLPDSLEDYAVTVPALPNSKSVIRLIPAGTVPSADYWYKLSQINWHDLFYAPGAKGVRLFLEMKELIRKEFDPDFLVVDSRTGITEIGGVATSILPEKLVCLLLANRENLDGARAVLRSLRRGPRLEDTEPPEIVPVLSRIPPQDEGEREEKLVAEILSFLNEKAERLEESLEISELLVLHSEPDLQMAESLRVGGDRSPEESILLRDYLRLFTKIIPTEIILPHIDTLVEEAKSLAFDDPEVAQKELESLTQLGHPHAYRELLKFYRLRNSPRTVVLSTAAGLWEITQNTEDPLLWQVVKAHFVGTYPGDRRIYVPPNRLKGDISLLHFVEAMWRSQGADDVEVGCDLAESFDNFNQSEHAVDLLATLVQNAGPNEKAVVQYLQQLMKLNRFAKTKDVITRFRESLSENLEFLSLWAKLAVEQRDLEFAKELLGSPLLERLGQSDPLVVYRLLMIAGRPKEAKEFSQRTLKEALRHGLSEELAEVGRLFSEIGNYEEFKQVVRSALSEREVERLFNIIEAERRVSPIRLRRK